MEKAVKVEQKLQNQTDKTPSPSDESLILKSGVIFLAFRAKNLDPKKKNYLISSNDGRGIFIKKTKVGEDGKTEKFILGLDENPGQQDSGDAKNKKDSIVALISGVEGEAKTRLEINEGENNNEESAKNIDQFVVGVPEPEPFRQKNVNKDPSDNFDFIKEKDLLFLTVIKNNDGEWEFWLTSSRAKNPYSQKIISNLDLKLYPFLHKKNLTWSNLGPKNPTETNVNNQNLQQKTTNPTIQFKGFAVYDSDSLARNSNAVSELFNHFIKEFKD